MFKSTEKIAIGEFSKIVARLGGNDNAFTGHDATAYFQRVTKDHLKRVMEMEADRMVNLRLTEKEVLTERDVILEERRSRVENSPQAILDEQMSAALYQNHPYGIPVIGWMHEMAKLSPQDALSFYKLHYAPNNAMLVVAGDVTAAEVKTLAEAVLRQSHSRTPRSSRASRAVRARASRAAPPRIERPARRQTVDHALLSGAELFDRRSPAKPKRSTCCMKIVAGGTTSRLYQALVVDQKIATSASGWYSGGGLDSGKIAVSAVVADGSDAAKVEAAIDAVIADIKANGVTEEEVTRGKKAYLAEYVYESDNQSTLARRYGWGMTLGRTIAADRQLASRLRQGHRRPGQAGRDQTSRLRRSVTGTMIPVADTPTGAAGAHTGPPAPHPARRSRERDCACSIRPVLRIAS